MKTRTANELLQLGRSYQAAAVLAAAADLELFDRLEKTPRTAPEIARALKCPLRGVLILLDALVALQLLRKQSRRYALIPGTTPFLTAGGAQSILAMTQHQANCLRRWAHLANAVQTGSPAPCSPSIRGIRGDAEAFIAAMDNISAPVADQVIEPVVRRPFKNLLDIGGASGTWTLAFLRALSSARATLFDLEHVIPMARRRVRAEGLGNRIKLVAGDFTTDPLPSGADLAWVSAIVHQNSREQNRALFAKVFKSLVPGGRIAIRDIIMEENRTQPEAGALFAVNMLVATPGGGTYTLAELREDLEATGFNRVSLLRRDAGMNAIVAAAKPALASHSHAHEGAVVRGR